MQKHTGNSLHPPHSLSQFVPFRTSYKPFPHMQKYVCIMHASECACVHVCTCTPTTLNYGISGSCADSQRRASASSHQLKPSTRFVETQEISLQKLMWELNIRGCAFSVSTKLCWYIDTTWMGGWKSYTHTCYFLKHYVK